MPSPPPTDSESLSCNCLSCFSFRRLLVFLMLAAATAAAVVVVVVGVAPPPGDDIAELVLPVEPPAFDDILSVLSIILSPEAKALCGGFFAAFSSLS